MRNIKNPKFPCRICTKNVHHKDKAVQCNLCELWIHIKCNNLNYLDYRYLQNCDQSWYCTECCNSLSSNKTFLACCTNTDSNINQWKHLENDHASSLSLKPSSNLELLVSQFSNATPENRNDPEKISSSKYYDIEEMHNIEITDNNKTLSLFHLNACSLNNYCTNLNNYSFEFTPTETSAGGTLLYIVNHLSYKCRNDLNIYKKNELESTFIETVNPKKSNILVGVIYRHPSMDPADFNCNYLNKLLENISKEQKSIFLLGDFNVSLLNYNDPDNVIDPDIISGNLTATISDDLPQFSIIPHMLGNMPVNKSNIYERDWSKFDRKNFILNCFSLEWDVLKIDELNADKSTKKFLDKINMLLDTYAPLKRVKKYKLKFKSKPWITLGLQKSISVKNKLFANFMNKKDPILKEECHTNYKKYRNLLSTLMKKSKQAYYDRYFEKKLEKY